MFTSLTRLVNLMGNLRDLIVNINYLKEKKRGTDSLYTFQPE